MPLSPPAREASSCPQPLPGVPFLLKEKDVLGHQSGLGVQHGPRPHPCLVSGNAHNVLGHHST